MQFQWSSALNSQALTEYKTQEVFIFEIAMVGFCVVCSAFVLLSLDSKGVPLPTTLVHSRTRPSVPQVLASKALAQINQASLLVDPSIDRFAEAGTLLKGAGGLFLVLAQDFLPRWKETRTSCV